MSPHLATPPAIATVLDFAFGLAPAAVRAPTPLASALLVLLTMGFAGSALA